MPSSVAAAWTAAEAVVAASIIEGGIIGTIAETIGVTATTALVYAGKAAATYAISAGVNSLLSSGGSGGAAASPASTGGAFAAQANTRTHMLRSTVANRQIIYGQVMISGPMVYATSNDAYGTLHLAIALAAHECEEIGEVYFNDEALGALSSEGIPTSGRYYLQTTTGGALTELTTDNQGVNREPPTVFQYHYVTLPHVPLTISISDAGLTTANSPTGTPYKDGGGTWTNVGYDSVAAGMKKNYPNDAGPGYIPWRQFGVNGAVVKMSASHSEGGNITITYTTTSGATVSYYARIRKHLGHPDQAADDALVALGGGWTYQHRLRGVAYLVASLGYGQEIYPRGIPNIKAVVKGKKLYDPRTGNTVWSDNPALVARDYIAGSYGLGCTSAEIDDASFIAAANVCDELVTLDGSGTTQKRYTCNGVVDMGQRPIDILQAIITSCGGMLVWQGGTWVMHAGAYSAPVGAALDADDLRGPIKVSARTARADLFNAIKGTFVDPARGWLPQDFPIQRNSTYVANDGGDEIIRDLTLPMTTNNIMAQRLAKMALDRARQGIIVQWPGKANLLGVTVGDTKTITLPHLGWTAKEFRVIDWTLSETGAVDLTLQEEASASYSWNYGYATTVDPAPDTALPAPWNVPAPTGLAAASSTNQLLRLADGTIVSRIYLSWDAAGAQVISTDLRWRRSTDTNWSEGSALDASAWIAPVEDGATYILQARHVGSMGYKSAWATVDHTVVGKSAPPGTVSSFTIAGNLLSWSAVSDLDLAGYQVRFHYGQNADWGTAQALHTGLLTASPFDMVARPAGIITLMLKAVDTSGNESAAAARIVTDLGDSPIANVVETIALDPAFSGALTGCTVSGGDLVADALDSFYGTDDQSFYGADTDPFYEASGYSAMAYVSGDIIVGSALAGSMATLVMTTQGADLTVEYRDAGPDSFYGIDADAFYGADADSFYGPPGAWQPFPGQVAVENAIYNLRVGIGAGTTRGTVETLALVIDAPDIVETIDDLAIAAAGTVIPYTKNFTAIKNVMATLQANASAAETIEVDKTSPLAPSIKAYTASHSAVTGATADITLKGY